MNQVSFYYFIFKFQSGRERNNLAMEIEVLHGLRLVSQTCVRFNNEREGIRTQGGKDN
jgi:hypothetical protein